MAFTDAGLVGALEKDFLTDLDLSEEIDLPGWKKRPLRRRAVEHAADLARQSL